MAYPRRQNILKNRSVLIVTFLIVFFLAIIARLYFLQIVKYDKYQSEVIRQMTSETTIRAKRGNIYTANRYLLVTNMDVWTVSVDPSKIEKYETQVMIAANLSKILDIEYDTVFKKAAYNPKSRNAKIKDKVKKEKADEIREFISANKLSSQVYLTLDTERYYCYDDLAAHVLGFTDTDGRGIAGLEYIYNDYLTGINGKLLTAHDARGNDMPYKYESHIDASNGSNLVTTIDLRIQYELENQLKAAYENSAAKNRVTGIVMDVNTGAIYAMATYPGYDANEPRVLSDEMRAHLEGNGVIITDENYYTLLDEMRNNKAVNDLYEPGSTFKVVTSAIALEEKAVKLTDHFTCYGKLKVSDYDIHCHKRAGHGTVSFAVGLQQSCNPTLMQTAKRIGRETFYKYFEAFGFRSKTGIDLPGESASITHEFNSFYDVELAVYSFGQTFKTTPLQELTAICTVANGGYLVKPHLMKEIVDDDGNTIHTYDTGAKRQVLSKETCDTLTQVLAEGVAGNGGAKNAYVRGYSVAAKTGTSEKRDKLDKYGEKSLRIGSCVAYAPADEPMVASIIIVDEPSAGNVYGSVVAAPYVSKLMGEILPYLGIEPQYTDAELASMEIQIRDFVGYDVNEAAFDIKGKGLSCDIIGNGETVVHQIPKGGSMLPGDSGRVLLYTGDAEPTQNIVVPDLLGRSAASANKLLLNKGLNINISGSFNADVGSSASVISQVPEAGTYLARGEIVTIEVRHLDATD